MAKTIRRTDWDSIPIVIDDDLELNPHNPYAETTPQERAKVLADLARGILLRRAKRIASN